MASIHQSPYSGSWYPGEAAELRALVDSVVERSRGRTGPYLLPNPIAFVVPHAGLMYSGTVAAAVYRYLAARPPRRIVLLGFSHRGGPAGVAIPAVDALETPLGLTRVDRATVAFLLTHPPFHGVAEDRVCDHSIEIQLPFLRKAAPDAAIVPLYVGPMNDDQRGAAARVLAGLAADGAVLLASSDLTHFGRAFGYEPFPVDEEIAGRLDELDRGVIEDAGSLDASLFLAGLGESGATVCGQAPIALLLRTLDSIASEEIFQETLDYQTSGDLTGDFRHSVSYGALGYFPASSFELETDEQALLLASARRTLAHFIRTGEREELPPAAVTPALTRRAGAFVTLHENGKLRGCVGTPGPKDQLARTVAHMTLAAALDDPRFLPLTSAEAGENGVEIEISVLTPLKRVRGRDRFRLHDHGAHLESGGRRSLLLPQVTREKNWTADRFWEALAQKAGLSPAIYEDPQTRLHVFRAQIIH